MLVQYISIITQVLIEILVLSLAKNGIIFCYNHLRRGAGAGGQISKMAVSCFVDLSEEEMVSQQIFTTVMTCIVVAKECRPC